MKPCSLTPIEKVGKGALGDAGHHRGHGARVDPAAEEGAHRDVAEQVQLDGLAQQRVEPVGDRRLVVRELLAEGEAPVLLLRQAPVLEDGDGRRGELVDAPEEGVAVGEVAQRDVVPEPVEVDLAPDEARGEHALDLGGEDQGLPGDRVEERLLPEVVAREHEPARRAVPEPDREHAAQAPDARGAQLLVEVQDHLDVGRGAEAVAAAGQLGAQLGAVVDLAVADELDVAGLVGDRLAAPCDVDDAQAPLAERDRLVVVEVLVVRAAVGQRPGHGDDELAVPRADDAGYAAHAR